MTVLGVLHHGLVVDDIDTAAQWYCDVLELELVHRQRQENAYTSVLVGVPGAVLEVAQLRFRGRRPTASTHDIELIQYVRAGMDGVPAPVNQAGSAHLGFVVDGIEALSARAAASGAVLRNEPVAITEGANAGGMACYLSDPDGNVLEFLQPPPDRLRTLRGGTG